MRNIKRIKNSWKAEKEKNGKFNSDLISKLCSHLPQFVLCSVAGGIVLRGVAGRLRRVAGRLRSVAGRFVLRCVAIRLGVRCVAIHPTSCFNRTVFLYWCFHQVLTLVLTI